MYIFDTFLVSSNEALRIARCSIKAPEGHSGGRPELADSTPYTHVHVYVLHAARSKPQGGIQGVGRSSLTPLHTHMYMFT